jgi:hypothetical protein
MTPCPAGEKHTHALDDAGAGFAQQAHAQLSGGITIESVRSSMGHYKITFGKAADVCAARGMELCSPAQVQQGFDAKLSICACSWASDANMYYTMQEKSSFCGDSVGIHDCGAKTYKGSFGDVFCCGVRSGPAYGTCTKCAPGTFSVNNECRPCGAGRYSGEGASTCDSCAAGRFNPDSGAVSSVACKSCGTGSYSTVGSSKCFVCPHGTEQGSTEATDAASCATCSAGRFAPIGGQKACELCPAGKYSTTKGATMCTSCPAGTEGVDAGSTTSLDCTHCGYGKYSIAGLSKCRDCPEGRASHVAGADNAATCKLCSAGKFAGWGSAMCTECAAGSYSTTMSDFKSCASCSAGRYLATKGATSPDACLICPKGHWCGSGASAPQECAAGFSLKNEGATTATDCTTCAAGTYHPDSGSAECIKCGVGTYQAQRGQTACVECPAGSAQPVEGATTIAQCEKCHAGKYQPVAGRGFCVECGDGFFAPFEGNIECSKCAKGTKGNGKRGATSAEAACDVCAAGTFNAVPSHSSCTACPAGKTSATVGATSESTCCSTTDANDCASKQDCVMSAWSTWTGCSKTCRATLHALSGRKTRTRSVQTEGSGSGALMCSEVNKEEEAICESVLCPVDCVVSDNWTAWGTCTASCGGGVSRRSRVIVTHAKNGGKCDTHAHCSLEQCTKDGDCDKCLSMTAKCNDSTCDPKQLPRCHGEHVHCKVVQKQMNHWTEGLKTQRNGGMLNDCNERWNYAYGNCHHCDTPAECALKGLHKTIVVTHDSKFAHLKRQQNMFQCFGSDLSLSSCFCTCRMHPPCTSHVGVTLTNEPIFGNRWTGILKQDCCNMCTNHPDCGSFTWTADNTCTLYSGSPETKLLAATDKDYATTWSGCQSGDIC